MRIQQIKTGIIFLLALFFRVILISLICIKSAILHHFLQIYIFLSSENVQELSKNIYFFHFMLGFFIFGKIFPVFVPHNYET